MWTVEKTPEVLLGIEQIGQAEHVQPRIERPQRARGDASEGNRAFLDHFDGRPFVAGNLSVGEHLDAQGAMRINTSQPGKLYDRLFGGITLLVDFGQTEFGRFLRPNSQHEGQR